MDFISKYSSLKDVLPSVVYKAISHVGRASMADADVIHKANPDATDWELRLRMTRIINKAEEESGDDKVDTTIWVEDDFCKGICQRNALRTRLGDEWKREFLFRPLHTFKQATDNIIMSVTARLYEISAIPITYEFTGPDGKVVKRVDHKNAKLVMDLAKLMLDRKLGLALARQVTVTASVPGKVATPADVEKEIKALEAEFDDTRKVPGSTSGEKEVTATSAVFSKREPDSV